MVQFGFVRNCLVVIILIQFCVFECEAKGGKKPGGSNDQKEKQLLSKIKAASPEKLRQGRRQAAMKLQSNFARAMAAMAAPKGGQVPPEVREDAKAIEDAIKGGQLDDTIFQSLPSIMINASTQGGNPSQQVQTLLTGLKGQLPMNLKSPVQGVLEFIKANQAGVNTLLTKTISGSPNLLNGVVQSLASTVGGANGAISGSGDSLNNMVGGLLAGLPV